MPLETSNDASLAATADKTVAGHSTPRLDRLGSGVLESHIPRSFCKASPKAQPVQWSQGSSTDQCTDGLVQQPMLKDMARLGLELG